MDGVSGFSNLCAGGDFGCACGVGVGAFGFLGTRFGVENMNAIYLTFGNLLLQCCAMDESRASISRMNFLGDENKPIRSFAPCVMIGRFLYRAAFLP